jgi:hypothetical protein
MSINSFHNTQPPGAAPVAGSPSRLLRGAMAGGGAATGAPRPPKHLPTLQAKAQGKRGAAGVARRGGRFK